MALDSLTTTTSDRRCIYIYNNPLTVTQQEWEKDFLVLPSWRKKKVLRYHFLLDRVLCTKAFLLLKRGMEECYGVSQIPEFSYGANGKPFFKEYPHIHFNMSHAKRGVMCVVDNVAVGCDIEDIPENLDNDLCDYCFNKKETEQILQASQPNVQFTRLWTLKEMVLKLTGEGINDNLPSLLTPELMGKVEYNTVECAEMGYVYSYGRFYVS